MCDLVSIIVPVYNTENYVEKCLDSLIRQTYSNFEIIVVNDGSTDRCREILDCYKEKNTNIKVYNKKNGGLASARNYGFDKSNGEYIYFIDSDDYIDDTTIEKLMRAIKNTNADIAIGGVRQVFPDGRYEYFHMNIEKETYDLCDEEWFIENPSIIHPAWNKLYKKDKIKVRFNESLKRNEDIEFNGKMYCDVDKITIVNEQLYFQLQSENSLTRTNLDFEEEYEFVKTALYNVAKYADERNKTNIFNKQIEKYIYFRLDLLLQKMIANSSDVKIRRNVLSSMSNDFPKWKYKLIREVRSYTIQKGYIVLRCLDNFHLRNLIPYYGIWRKIITK